MSTLRIPTLDEQDDVRLENLPRSVKHPSSETVLPSSPPHGDEVYYQTATMKSRNEGPWHFRYDSTITDEFKWQFLGGPPVIYELQGEYVVPPEFGTGYGTAVSLGATLSRSGIYTVHYGAEQVNDDPLYNVYTTVYSNLDVAGDLNRLSSSGNRIASPSKTRPLVVSANAASVRMAHRTDGGTGRFSRRFMVILPIRVA